MTIEENSCRNARIVEGAVSDSNRNRKFYEGKNSAAGSLHPLDFDPQGSILVNVIFLDEEVRNKNIPVPDLIKIDVEGEEYAVLKGTEQILKNYSPQIILSIVGS